MPCLLHSFAPPKRCVSTSNEVYTCLWVWLIYFFQRNLSSKFVCFNAQWAIRGKLQQEGRSFKQNRLAHHHSNTLLNDVHINSKCILSLLLLWLTPYWYYLESKQRRQWIINTNMYVVFINSTMYIRFRTSVICIGMTNNRPCRNFWVYTACIANFHLFLVSHTKMWQWLICWQSFVIAVLAMVIATFSTGIDSKCFQVCSTAWITSNWSFIAPLKCTWQYLQFRKDETESEDDVPYGYGFFHFVFATGAMYFAMLLIGWNTHQSMKKYFLLSCDFAINLHLCE